MSRATVRVLVVWAVLVPGVARAQQNGTIAGIVTDTTGSLWPGVTIETSSPALIEQTRTAVSDGRGQYRVVDLRPGHLQRHVHVAGVHHGPPRGHRAHGRLHGGGECRTTRGKRSETVTVQGATPVVDVQNVNQQRVMTQEVLASVPTGRSVWNYATLVPGVIMSNSSLNSQDVGGGTGFNFAFAAIHGGRAPTSRSWSTGCR